MADPVKLPDGTVTTAYTRGDFCARCHTFIQKGRNGGKLHAVDRRTHKGAVDVDDDTIRKSDYHFDQDYQVCGDCFDEFRDWFDAGVDNGA